MRAVNVSASTQVNVAASAGTVRYAGFSLRETSGSAAALVRIWDSENSTTTGKTVLEEIALAAGESARESYGNGTGMPALLGIYAQVVSGAVAGSVRTD